MKHQTIIAGMLILARYRQQYPAYSKRYAEFEQQLRPEDRSGGTDGLPHPIYPAQAFTTPITLTAFPDRPVTIGQ